MMGSLITCSNYDGKFMLSSHWFWYPFQMLQITEYIKEIGMAEGIGQMLRKLNSLHKSDHSQGFGSQQWQMLTEIHFLVHEKDESCNMTSQKLVNVCTGEMEKIVKVLTDDDLKSIFAQFFSHNISMIHTLEIAVHSLIWFKLNKISFLR